MGSCFYEKGLKFECQGCNYCCSSEPGYVFLSENDIKRLSDGLSMDRQSFIDTYCRVVDMGAFKMISLLEKDNYDCIFLQEAWSTSSDRIPGTSEQRGNLYSHRLSVSDSSWHRERIVGSSADGRPVVRMNRHLPGGSSSVFKKAFCADSFMVSASWITPIFHPDALVLLKWNCDSNQRSVSGSSESFPITISRALDVGESK